MVSLPHYAYYVAIILTVAAGLMTLGTSQEICLNLDVMIISNTFLTFTQTAFWWSEFEVCVQMACHIMVLEFKKCI